MVFVSDESEFGGFVVCFVSVVVVVRSTGVWLGLLGGGGFTTVVPEGGGFCWQPTNASAKRPEANANIYLRVVCFIFPEVLTLG